MKNLLLGLTLLVSVPAFASLDKCSENALKVYYGLVAAEQLSSSVASAKTSNVCDEDKNENIECLTADDQPDGSFTEGIRTRCFKDGSVSTITIIRH